jgi:ABC-2 type transport system ATP-binding protein
VEDTPAALKAVVGADLVTLRTGDDAAAVRAIREQFGLEVTEGRDGAQLRVAGGARFVPKLCARRTAPVHSVTVVRR